jgi:hypothetical protein
MTLEIQVLALELTHKYGGDKPVNAYEEVLNVCVRFVIIWLNWL